MIIKSENRELESLDIQEKFEEEIKIREKYGLCTTCIHNEDCSLKQKAEEKIIFCEEFDNGVVPQKIHIPKETKIQSNEEFKGICVNCENRFHCTLVKPESGIWHCEEYK